MQESSEDEAPSEDPDATVPDEDDGEGDKSEVEEEVDMFAYEGELERGRNGWISLADDDGYVYYHNEQTGLTQWERPDNW